MIMDVSKQNVVEILVGLKIEEKTKKTDCVEMDKSHDPEYLFSTVRKSWSEVEMSLITAQC